MHVQRYVASVAAVGLVGAVSVLVVAPLGWPPTTNVSPWALPVVLMIGLVLAATPVDVLERDIEAAHTLDEVMVVAALVLLQPGWALAAVVLVSLAGEVLGRRPLAKAAFNVGWSSAAAAAAVGAYHLLAPAEPFDVAGLAAAYVALLLFTGVNAAAIAGLQVALGEPTPWWRVFGQDVMGLMITASAVGAVGLVAAFLMAEGPALLPLLAIPLLVVRERAEHRRERHAQQRRERERLHRTLAGTSDGMALVAANGDIELWNPTLADLTGCRPDDAVGRPLDDVLQGLLDRPLDEGSEPQDRALVGADGRARTVQIDRAMREPGAEGPSTVLTVRDVTARAELERLREDLVTRVAHELRTPLTSVTGLVETVLVRWDQLEPAARRELLERSHAASRRLGGLLDAVLVQARIERSASRPEPARVDLDPLIDRVASDLESAVKACPVERRPGGHTVFVDPDQLETVLRGLLTNAATYGEPPVVVETCGDDHAVTICVADQGPGVPPEFETALFAPFAQASVGLQRTARGLGLGLSIARGLAEANGGSLQYERRDDGASFVLRLPAAATR